LIQAPVGNVGTSCPDVGTKFKWRTHENESAEKYLNLEKHQDADGFPLKDCKIFSKNFMELIKINKKK
jgi:hypothetical protein